MCKYHHNFFTSLYQKSSLLYCCFRNSNSHFLHICSYLRQFSSRETIRAIFGIYGKNPIQKWPSIIHELLRKLTNQQKQSKYSFVGHPVIFILFNISVYLSLFKNNYLWLLLFQIFPVPQFEDPLPFPSYLHPQTP